ncbi:MAG: hypothetical protein LBG17_04680 [Bacteroidales bacterium]|nr:hypothetical protein [Bacteroidales bacterium]
MSTTKEVCVYPFAAKGGIKAISLVNAGGSYTSGTANNVPLSGGSGKGATANLTVSSGGVVTVVTIVNAGAGYRAGDALSYNGTGGTGATFSVTETSPAKYNDDATTQGVSGVVGILRKSVMRDAPLASILTRGTVNWHALPDDYPQNHDGIDVPVTIRIKSPSDSSVL